MAGFFIPSVALGGLADLLRELGGDPAELAAKLGIPAEALYKPDIPVPASAVYQSFERAGELCGCRDFGLRMSSRTSLAILGPLWILLRSAATVRQLAQELVANEDVFTRASRTTLEPVGDGLLLCWEPVSGVTDSTVQLVEFVMALACHSIRTHARADYQPVDVMFRHAAPPDLAMHRRIFGSNLRFNQDRSGIYLDRATLELPNDLASGRTRALMRSVLRLEDDAGDRGIATQVEAVVRALLPFSACTVQEVGNALGLSERTLQNRLVDEEQSFKGIKDKVRADLAMKYLRSSTLSLSDIAGILGYSELSAFSRSFKRWHGVSASSVRNQSARKQVK
ncbi:AraC family transcriptional regulator [Solimonas sp. K1W22B-7]|uniref:AraC family transcriptional regulator n=1 Tax=Solimonas sp. K1W22B-7 TaxID=2303331 RepID=UPI0013C457EA|nr:AraC family transcriptional regulator [Solimonas sp. K1W22B-7]